MPSTGIPATCWFNRWYLFHEGQQENRRYPYGKGEAPRRIFCRKRYPARPCGLPEQKIAGAGLSDPAERGVPLIPASSPPAPPAREPSSSKTRLLKLSAYSPKSRMSYTPGRRCGVLHASFSGSRPGPHKESTGPRPHPGNVLPPPGRQARRKYDPGKVRHPPQEKAAVQGSEA